MTVLRVVPAGDMSDVDSSVRELSIVVRDRLSGGANQAASLAAELRTLRERVHWLRDLHTTLGGTAAQLEAIAASLAAEEASVDEMILPREPILARVDEDHARRVRMALGSGE